MSKSFNEYDAIGREIQNIIETVMLGIEAMYKINYLGPPHDIARRFLNEIYEFKPASETDENTEG